MRFHGFTEVSRSVKPSCTTSVDTPPRKLCSHAYGGVEHNLRGSSTPWLFLGRIFYGSPRHVAPDARSVKGPALSTPPVTSPPGCLGERSEHRLVPCQAGAAGL